MLALPVLYFALKYAAYVSWCYLGLKKFRPAAEEQQATAFLYGFYRLMIGFLFGAIIFFAVVFLAPIFGSSAIGGVFTYICAYVPVRWLEWTIMSILIIPGSSSLARQFVGLHESDRLWRFGGIGVSFLADLPILIAVGGFPVGRILC